MPESGTLYVVAVPIGNGADLSAHAHEILGSVDVVACEDTRVTGLMLSKLGLRPRLISYYEHVETRKAEQLLDLLQSGKSLALVSDAGTPLISDPGYVIVRRAREQNIRVIPVPGPSAVMAALSVSGMPGSRFYFAGFLPKRETELIATLHSWQSLNAETIVFYESAQRVRESLRIIHEQYGDLRLLLAREISKPYEEYLYGTISDVLDRLRSVVKGEITCVLEGIPQRQESLPPEIAALASDLISRGLTKKDVVTILSTHLSLPRNSLKRLL